MAEASNSFEGFLERLRTGRLPQYGTLRWDGQCGEVVTAINFELDRSEPVATVCERAHRFFSQLSGAERRSMDIEITTRAGKPVRATLRPAANGIITTGRLRELEGSLKTPKY